MTLGDVENALEDADALVVGLIRDDIRMPAPSPLRKVQAGDILVIEAEPEALSAALAKLGLALEEAVEDDSTGKALQSAEITLMELVVQPGSALMDRSASDIHLRTRYGINLLAVSRQGRRSVARLRTMKISVGDVLLMQGAPETLMEFASDFSCVPLAARPVRLPDKTRAITASAIMVAAAGGAALGLLPAAVSFTAGVLAMMAFKVIPLRNVYNAVDWPVIVLLGALFPVADAMATTGAADLIAQFLLDTFAFGNPALALAVILVVTMTLSDFMNNAATAAVMCPIAIGAAAGLGVNADPFLMAVAVGASCAFLTPIGHQNNTLILGPGGLQFGDYWKLGLPLEILVIAIGVPMIITVWPF
jgi:di/tricarboxylate transporter